MTIHVHAITTAPDAAGHTQPATYRGFHLGWAIARRGRGYIAAWRSSLESGWILGHIVVESVEDVPGLARECVDFKYRMDVEEVILERKLTREELAAMAKR